MPKKLQFLVIDDSEPVLEIYISLLSKAGHDVAAFTSCDRALEYIAEHQPDCVLCDLILPGMDGLELLKQVRNNIDIKQPTFIVVSGKQFDYDRRRALEAGADAYMTKPIDPEEFVPEILSHIYSRIKIKFWGVRGTLPVPGIRSLRHGGNTNCITLNIGNKHRFIFDAGTGIKELSNHILAEEQLPYKAKIFISHPHYDHINGIPYFMPLYMKGNDFEFLGSDQGSVTLKQYLSDQMDSVYFPVTMSEFSSTVKFRSLTEESFMIDDIKIETLLLNHPGRCLGYRLDYKGKIFCYITDNELYLKTDVKHYNEEEVNRLIRFINEADVLIIDATYTDEEYVEKIGWGHSPLTNVVEIADKAKVKLLCLHHHDPDQSDDDIDLKLLQARTMLAERKSNTKCIAPHEGDEIIL
jgi:CheY-like chemotaxis protein